MAGELATVRLTDALEGATVFFVVGFNDLYMPGLGGTVVPDPTGVGIVLFETSGEDGSLTLAGAWPPGAPDDFELYFQAWIQDPDGPEGFTASNGLSLRTP